MTLGDRIMVLNAGRVEQIGTPLVVKLHPDECRGAGRIDAAPWYQPLSFALRAMLNADQFAATFWMIRPDTLTPVKLTAEKQQVEPLNIEGHSVDARRVRVSVAGWASMLWHSHYWFRADDHLFVQYRGVNGPPGIPETVVRLVM